MNLLGRTLFSIYAIRVYQDGDSLGFVWNWWHPASWIFAPLTLLTHMLVEGVPTAWHYRYDAGWCMAPFYKEHPEKLQWISRG